MMHAAKALGNFSDRLDAMVLGGRFRGRLSEQVTLVLVGVLPFLPRPTLEHPIRFIVPVFMLLFLAINIRPVLSAMRDIPRAARLRELSVIGGILVAAYFAWSVGSGHIDELSRVLARGLWIAIYLCMVAWFFATGISIRRVYKCLFVASVLLSVLVVLVGLTGVTIFEAPRPGRTYGVAIPFFKNTGIPRSYGEFGILMSIAWAYWLVHFRTQAPLPRTVSGLLLIMAAFISQSRSTYLAILTITIAFAVSRLLRNRSDRIRAGFFQVVLIASVLLPVLLEAVLASPIGQLGFVQAMIGEETFEDNVFVRFLVIGSALEALLDGGASALFGISHAAWDAGFEALGQRPVALHNHFLSNLVFYGVVGGTISLLTFFVWPFLGVLRRHVQYGDKTSLIALLALFGAIVNLHFYEGFFSLILALELALLWCISRGLMLETRALARPINRNS